MSLFGSQATDRGAGRKALSQRTGLLVFSISAYPLHADTLCKAMDTLKEGQKIMVEFLGGDTSKGAIDTLRDAQAIFSRVKMTKLETLCCRTLRDSWRKREHLEKYVAMFAAEAAEDWRKNMWPRLMQKVLEIVGPATASSNSSTSAGASAPPLTG